MRLRDGLILAFLALLVGGLYGHTLDAPFVFDDEQNIQKNPQIRLTSLSVPGLLRAGFASPLPRRPVANISFALNYYVHQYRVWGYHVVNLLIHLTTGFLLYLVVQTTLRLPGLRPPAASPDALALCTALLWLVHPLHIQSVTYIVQRMTSLAALFYLLALLLYARARLAGTARRRWALFAGCGLAGLLALGTKETAVTLPIFVVLYEWYFFQGLRWSWVKRRALLLAGLVLLGGVVAVVYLGPQPWARIMAGYAPREFTVSQRLLTEARVVVVYLRLLVAPQPSALNLDHDVSLSYGLLAPPTTVLALGVLGALLGLACGVARRAPVLSFGLLWFLGNLVLESSVIGLELMFEHRTYLPSTLLSWLVVMGGYRLGKPAWLRVAVVCAVVVVFSVWTYERNRVWRDAVTLWSDVVAKSPHKARPHYNLGLALANQGRLAEAIEYYTQALRLRPTYVEAHNNLGVALAKQDRLAEAMAHYAQALRFDPAYVEAHNNLGNALAKQGRFAEATAHYTQALRLRPTYVEAHYNLGLAYSQQGQGAKAMAAYRTALRYQPNSPEAANNLAWLLVRQANPSLREVTEAVQLAETACRITGNRNAAMLHTLAVVYAAAGRRPDAVRTAYKALAQAEAAGEAAVADEIQAWLERYETGVKKAN